MNQERLILQGRMSEATRKLAGLKLEARNLISNIRMGIDPHQPDLAALPVDEAGAAMNRLQTIVYEIRDLKKQIAEMEESLG